MASFRQCRCGPPTPRNPVGTERERPRSSGLRDDDLFLGYKKSISRPMKVASSLRSRWVAGEVEYASKSAWLLNHNSAMPSTLDLVGGNVRARRGGFDN